jgi:putative ABC transport system substrate-binding protein
MECIMDRRQFVVSLAGAAIAGPTVASAQTSRERPGRIALMVALAENDPEGLIRVEAFRQSLQAAGWEEGRNVVVDVSWYDGKFEVAQVTARNHLERGADVFVVNGTPGLDAVRALGTNLPIVFAVVTNPVGAGYVPSLSRPGGNITGFSTFEPEIAGKWLQLLARLVPGIKNVSMLLDPKFTGFNSLWQTVETIAPTLGIVPHAAYAADLQEIEQALAIIARREAPGLIVSPSPINTVNRASLIANVNANQIPAVFPFRFYVRYGALMAYGFNAADQFRRAGVYASRILKGENPGDLPVQAPSLFELGINLVTAKAMGIAVPRSLLITADEIVE